jgi:hypothetical protein
VSIPPPISSDLAQTCVLTRRQRACYTGSMARTTPKRLRQLAPGVSLRELSRRTDIRLEHLSRIFGRKRGLTLDKARKIANALNLPVDMVADTLAPKTTQERAA